MYDQIEKWKCDMHINKYDCPDAILDYNEVFDEYGITIYGDPSVIIINYCPWCWTKLPDSTRNQWFNQLEELWFSDPLFNDNIPEKYKTDQWHKS